MDALGVVGVGADLYMAAQHARVLLDARQRALDPSLTDAEADALFEKAQAAANGLIESGLMGALMERYPPFAAAVGTWVLTRHGGEWILANTETGQAINRAATNYLDRHISALERAGEDITEFLGGESDRMRRQSQIDDMCASFTRAIREKRIRLKPGKKSVDVCNYIRDGDLAGIHTDLIDPTPPQPVVETDPCEAPHADLAKADALLETGDLGAAENAFGAISAAGCDDVAEAVADRQQSITAKIDQLADAADKAATSCDGKALRTAASGIAEANHPRLASANSAVQRVVSGVTGAEAAFANANAAFRSGDMVGARSNLQVAAAHYDQLGSDAGCAGKIQKVEVATSKVERVAGAVARVDAAIHACDLDKMARFGEQLAKLKDPPPALKQRIGTLVSAAEDCKRNNPELQRVAADADCLARRGSGYSAGTISADGTYTCLPDKQTANAWCNSNNAGSGWHATKVQPDGSYDCRLSKTGRNAVLPEGVRKGLVRRQGQREGQVPVLHGQDRPGLRLPQEIRPRLDGRQAPEERQLQLLSATRQADGKTQETARIEHGTQRCRGSCGGRCGSRRRHQRHHPVSEQRRAEEQLPPQSDDGRAALRIELTGPAGTDYTRRMSPPKRKLAAVLAADVAGYSRLMGEDETRTLAALRDFRGSLFEPATAEHNGTVIKSMGDGWLVEFDSVVDAVNCAVFIQEALDENDVLKLRIGIHIGDIVHEDDDIYGDGVNVAARLQQIARPGGIVLSDFAHRGIDATLGARFANLGAQSLKNIRNPVTAYGWPSEGGAIVAAPETGPEKPAKRLDKDLRVSGLLTLVTAPGVAVLGVIIGFQEPAALIPLLGASLLVAFIGGGLMLASKIIGRWQDEP